MKAAGIVAFVRQLNARIRVGVSEILGAMPKRQRWQKVAGWLAVSAVLALVHYEPLLAHIQRALDPTVANDDARQQIYPFFKYEDRQLFQNDYPSEYYLDLLPLGFRALYTMAGYAGVTESLSKVLPYLLLLVALAAVAFVSSRFAGRWGALASVSLMLGAELYLARMSGGLPRAFAYPLVAVALALLAAGRLRWLAILVPIAAAFYPVVAVTSGLSLAITSFFFKAEDRGDFEAYGKGKRLALVAASALACLAVVAPVGIAAQKYGDLITPSTTGDYPEAGKHGRYGPDHRPPFADLLEGLRRTLTETLVGTGEPLFDEAAEWRYLKDGSHELSPEFRLVLDLALVGLAVGFALLCAKRAACRRIAALALAVAVGHIAARFVSPHLYLPVRYLIYAVPLLIIALLPGALVQCWRHVLPDAVPERWNAVWPPIVALLLLFAFGSTGPHNAGLNARGRDTDSILNAIEKLPKDALIAGWPLGKMDAVPYFARRRVLVSYELHQAFHKGYVLEFRRRTRALVNAYFATSPAPLQRLKKEFGVTHLLIHQHHLKNRPSYFAPFPRDINSAWRKARKAGKFEVLRQREHAAVFQQRGLFLLDLSRIRT